MKITSDIILRQDVYTIANYAKNWMPTKASPVKRENQKTGRNENCPCGSGKKHKKCCYDNMHYR